MARLPGLLCPPLLRFDKPPSISWLRDDIPSGGGMPQKQGTAVFIRPFILRGHTE